MRWCFSTLEFPVFCNSFKIELTEFRCDKYQKKKLQWKEARVSNPDYLKGSSRIGSVPKSAEERFLSLPERLKTIWADSISSGKEELCRGWSEILSKLVIFPFFRHWSSASTGLLVSKKVISIEQKNLYRKDGWLTVRSLKLPINSSLIVLASSITLDSEGVSVQDVVLLFKKSVSRSQRWGSKPKWRFVYSKFDGNRPYPFIPFQLLRNFKIVFPEDLKVNYYFLQQPSFPVSIDIRERPED